MDKEKETSEIKKQLDILCAKYQGKDTEDLHNYEALHRAYILKEYGRFYAQFKVFFKLSNHIVNGINYLDKKEWPTYRGLQWLFIVHNLRVLHSAVDRLVDGHWEDALTLGRGSLEAFVRIVWISCNPNDYEGGVLHKPPKGKRCFNFTNFIKDDLGLNWHDHHIMSSVAHGNQIRVVKDWVSLAKGENIYPIGMKIEFEKMEFEIALNVLMFIYTSYLLLLTEVFAPDPKEPNLPKSILDDAKEFVDCKKRTMRTHAKDYWPKVADDMDDLVALMKASDNGAEYKSEWEKIRNR